MTTTTIAARQSAWDTLEEALRQQRPVELTYHGRQRRVSPHALGWKNNRAMLLAYQSADPTNTPVLPADPRRQWRNLFVDDINHAALADPAAAWETADNYNPAHPFNSIDRVSIAIAPADRDTPG
jgi:hypothetical protein